MATQKVKTKEQKQQRSASIGAGMNMAMLDKGRKINAAKANGKPKKGKTC